MSRRSLCLAGIFALACAGAVFGADTDSRTAAILTPQPAAKPRINGARVYGERPGRPFLYHVPTTGQRPISFTATGLPDGLKIDSSTGTITGNEKQPGTYAVHVEAKNGQGSDSADLKIVIGDTIDLTPQMGWNSWNFFHRSITDAKVRAAADAMVSSGLVEHGWTYVNVDDCWQADRDSEGRIQGNEKFPDMKALCEYVHSKGLKFGTYSSPGPKTCAGFTGSYGHEAQDVQTYAQWGVDYVKYDWCSYGQIAPKHLQDLYCEALPKDADQIRQIMKEQASLPRGSRRSPLTAEQRAKTQELRKKLDAILQQLGPEKRQAIEVQVDQQPYRLFGQLLEKADRDIIFSLCQYGMGDVWKWGDQVEGNSWRTTGDIQANWPSIERIGFSQSAIAQYAKPGHWNDPDMLEVGNGNLTPDEMYTHFSLWCMLSSPLLIGCDMSNMDPLTVSIFSNDEVIAVDQDALGREATRRSQDGKVEVWAKPLADGSIAVGLFNRGSDDAPVTAQWADLGIKGSRSVRDLWRQKDLGKFDGSYQATVHRHGVVLVKISAD